VVLTPLPFKAMALALTVKLLRSALLPRAPSKATLPPPLAFTVKARAVPSLLMVLPVRIRAVLPEASKVASTPKVMAPVYVWLPLELTLPAKRVLPLTLNLVDVAHIATDVGIAHHRKVLVAAAMSDPLLVVMVLPVQTWLAPKVMAPL
jgi:hypothetical protein